MLNLNNITLELYDRSGARVIDAGAKLDTAERIKYTTQYGVGGLYTKLTFRIVRDVAELWDIKGAYGVKVKNGLVTVWEGAISNLPMALEKREQYVEITALGYWGWYFERRRWRKRWADMRTDDNAWAYDESATGADFCTIERNGKLRFVPKSEAWTNGDLAAIVYTMPTGQTVKRVTFDYEFAESSQQWKLSLYDATNGEIWSVTADGTGSQDWDYTTGGRTAVQSIQFRFTAQANQTAISDGTVDGELNNVTVYSETGGINLTEIVKDIQGRLDGEGLVSGDTNRIGSNSYSLVPFIADDWETQAQICYEAASYGDSSQNAWAVGLLPSELSSDGLPVVFAEAYPALTGADYLISLDETNLEAPFKVSQDVDNVYNWVVVNYADEDGRPLYVTPDDDATLTDADSVALYGQLDALISIDTSSLTNATQYGKLFLARHKDLQFHVSGPIQVIGTIRGADGRYIPVSEVRAGKRLKIENFMGDLSGAGFTVLIAGTEYDDERESVRISVGTPDDLAIILAQGFEEGGS